MKSAISLFEAIKPYALEKAPAFLHQPIEEWVDHLAEHGHAINAREGWPCSRRFVRNLADDLAELSRFAITGKQSKAYRAFQVFAARSADDQRRDEKKTIKAKARGGVCVCGDTLYPTTYRLKTIEEKSRLLGISEAEAIALTGTYRAKGKKCGNCKAVYPGNGYVYKM